MDNIRFHLAQDPAQIRQQSRRDAPGKRALPSTPGNLPDFRRKRPVFYLPFPPFKTEEIHLHTFPGKCCQEAVIMRRIIASEIKDTHGLKSWFLDANQLPLQLLALLYIDEQGLSDNLRDLIRGNRIPGRGTQHIDHVAR